MKKSIMQKWVKALRSGEYLQTKYNLCNDGKRDEHSFCCLGVLTNIYVEENGNAEEAWRHNSTLREPVIEWAGMKSDDGDMSDYEDLTILTELNDEGLSFKKIASIIQKNYKIL